MVLLLFNIFLFNCNLNVDIQLNISSFLMVEFKTKLPKIDNEMEGFGCSYYTDTIEMKKENGLLLGLDNLDIRVLKINGVFEVLHQKIMYFNKNINKPKILYYSNSKYRVYDFFIKNYVKTKQPKSCSELVENYNYGYFLIENIKTGEKIKKYFYVSCG